MPHVMEMFQQDECRLLSHTRQSLIHDVGLQWMRDTADPLLTGPIPSPVYVKALERLQGYALGK
jgi:hypothetical protein